MRASISSEHPLHRWFTGLVQNAMYAEVGVCDPALTDYLAELLTGFVHNDRIFALRDEAGRPLDQVVDMLASTIGDLSMPAAARERVVHRHIGDFTLFWTGVFPENLRRLCARNRKDYLIDYCRQGKRSYALASELSAESARPPASLLRRLSEEFERCVYGLGLVREQVRGCAATCTTRR